MEVIHPHACGIDLGGNRSHFCAIEIGVETEVREFGMTTTQLCELAEYLLAHGITSVAMEATGVYWMPVYDMLEHVGLEVFLVNPTHAKNVPGRRKDDKLDCRWLLKLHKYGLLSASFRPAEEIRPLRSMLRHRQMLLRETTDYLRRMQKVLDMMNVRIHKAVSDLGGQTGMRILRALVGGEYDPVVLARMRDPRCACSEEELREELTGYYQPHLITQLASLLRLYDEYGKEIALVDGEIEHLLQELTPLSQDTLTETLSRDTHALPKGKHALGCNGSAYVEMITGKDPSRLPGLGPQMAVALLGELGKDMTRWPSVKHFGAYLTVAPVEKISGGRRISSRTHPGTHPAAVIFRQAAAVVVHQGHSALAAFYWKVAKRRGKAKAMTALAYKIARMYYYLMLNGWAYVETGEQHYEEQYRAQELAAIQKRARRLGYEVSPIAA
jgi:transposase